MVMNYLYIFFNDGIKLVFKEKQFLKRGLWKVSIELNFQISFARKFLDISSIWSKCSCVLPSAVIRT